MRLKLLAVRKNIINAIQARKYCGRPPYCDPHMNELPVPCKPWNPWYKDKQNAYNKFLVFGALWWVFSLGMCIWTNSIFFNFKPPRTPAPPSDMVEECEDDEVGV